MKRESGGCVLGGSDGVRALTQSAGRATLQIGLSPRGVGRGELGSL
jgi:hypothetical protein